MQLAALVLLVWGVGVGYQWQPMPGASTSCEGVVQFDPARLTAMPAGESMPIVCDPPHGVGPIRRIRFDLAQRESMAPVRVTSWKPVSDGNVQPAQYRSPYHANQYANQGGAAAPIVASPTQFDPYAKSFAPGSTTTARNAPGSQLPAYQTPQAVQSPMVGNGGNPPNSYSSTSAAAGENARQPAPAGYAQDGAWAGPQYGSAAGPIDRLGQSIDRAVEPVRDGLQRVDDHLRSTAADVGDRSREFLDQLGRPLADGSVASSQGSAFTANPMRGQPSGANVDAYGRTGAARSIMVSPSGRRDPNSAASGPHNSAAAVGGHASTTDGFPAQRAPYENHPGQAAGPRGAQPGAAPSSAPLLPQYGGSHQYGQPSPVQPGYGRGTSPNPASQEPVDNGRRAPNAGGNFDRWTSTNQAGAATSASAYRENGAGAVDPRYATEGSGSIRYAETTDPRNADWPQSAGAPYGRPSSSTPSPGVSVGGVLAQRFRNWFTGQEGARVAANPRGSEAEGPSFPRVESQGPTPSGGGVGTEGYEGYEPFASTGTTVRRNAAPSISSNMLRQRSDATLEGGEVDAPTSRPSASSDDASQNRTQEAGWGALLGAWVLLSGSVAGNLYLFWSYLDVRARFQSVNRQSLRASRDRLSAA